MCLGAEAARLLVWSVVNIATNLPLNLLLFPDYFLYIFWWLPRKPLQHLNICYVTLFSWQILPLENTQWEDKARKMLNKNMWIAGPNEFNDFKKVPAYSRVSVWRAVCFLPEFTLACVHYSMQWGTRWRSWLRHCATSRNIADSIPDGANVIFHWHNPSGRTMALVSIQTNRNEYQEYLLGSKGGRCVGLKTLQPSCADCLEIWEPQPPGTIRTCPGLQWDCFTSHCHAMVIWNP